MSIEPPVSTARGRSPGAGWNRAGRGLHFRGEPSLAGEVAAWSQLLRPTAAFTHLTSAAIRGWWLPPLPDGLPVWVTQIASQSATTRDGSIVIRRRCIPPSEMVGGIRLATAAETLVTCAFDLGLLDLVVLIDSALHTHDVSLEELRTVAREHRRGAPALRRALPWVDGRSESPWESLLRVLHVCCGVAVEPQKEFRHGGRFVARADLWVVGTNAIHEYDGDAHLTVTRQSEDLKRSRRLVDADIIRRGYTSRDVLHQPIGILRDADRSLGREHRPQRVQAWNKLLRESLFTEAGTARLRERLGLAETPEEKNGPVGA